MVSCHNIMTRQHITSLKRREKQLLRAIRDSPQVMRGSFAVVHLTCGKKGCRCQSGDRHEAYRFSYRVQGRSRSVSVPKRWAHQIEQRHEAWMALKAVLEELTDVQVQIFQAEMKMDRKRRKKG